MTQRKLKRISMLALVVSALIVAACGESEAALQQDEPQDVSLGLIDTPNPDGLPIGYSIGDLAPNFRLETLEGDSLALSDLRGTPVFLNFFAVWCGPCRFEIPEMEKVHQSLGDSVTVVAINVNEPRKRVSAYRDIMGVTFTMALDEGKKISGVYQIAGISPTTFPLPFTYIIDGEGIIRVKKVGAFLSEEEILGRLREVGVEG